MLKGALALTGLDILTHEDFREKINREFYSTVPKYTKDDLE